MRTFHTLVFDELVQTGVSLYTDPTFNDVFASTDQLSVFAVATALAGTSPALAVEIEESPDEIHWVEKSGSPIFSGVLTVMTPTTRQGRDNGAVPSSGFIRLRIDATGTGALIKVRMWVALREDMS